MPAIIREVLIPMPGQEKTEAGALARVTASDVLPAADGLGGFPPEVAHLKVANLAISANHGLGAVREVVRERSTRFSTAVPIYALDLHNPGDLVGLVQANASSAQLGLAIAGLLGASRVGGRVAATGTLDLSETARQVGSVGQLPEKFKLLLDHAQRPARAELPKIFFVPTRAENGQPVKDVHQAEIAALKDAGVRVVPIATLDEVLDHVDMGGFREPPLLRGARLALTACIILFILALPAYLWLSVPPPLAWMPDALPDGHFAFEPYARTSDLVETAPPTSLIAARPCRQSGELPWVPVGSDLAFGFVVGTAEDRLVALGGGYAYAIVTVSLVPEPRTRVYETGRVAPGETISRRVPVKGAANESALAVFARRGPGYEGHGLELGIRARLAALKGKITAANVRTVLLAENPDALVHLFIAGGDGTTC